MKYDEFHELTTGDQFYLINLYGQNHMLTSFSKTIFPNLSIYLAYIKTNFAINQSKCSNLGYQLVLWKISFDKINLEMILP